MVKYTGEGRTISCPDTGQTFFCMTSVSGTSYNLKRDCAGNYCDVPGGVNEDPTGWPPADQEAIPWLCPTVRSVGTCRAQGACERHLGAEG